MKTPLRLALNVAFVTAVICPPLASANTALWIGNPNVTVTTNWSDNANWNNVGGGSPGPFQNDVKFGGVGSAGTAGTITSVADVNQRPLSLQFSNNTLAGSPEFHTVHVPAGVTITNDGLLIVGGVTVNTYRTIVNITGNGTLLQRTNMTIGNNGASAADVGTLLDLSALDNFVFNNANGSINLGSGNRSAGDFRMAAVSNYVVAAAFNANIASASSGATGTLTFGAGTNSINVNTFTAGVGRNTCNINSPGTGGLRLRGAGGDDTNRVTMLLGNHNVTGTGSTAAGTLSLNGHTVDMKLNTLTLGTSTAAPTGGSNPGNGTLSFDMGVVDATNILMAIANNVSFNSANGTINVGASATLIIGNGGLSLCNLTGAASAATGNLNVNSGAVISSNNIFKTTTAGVGNITMAGGSLTLAANRNIGAQLAPIDNLALAAATLNVSVVNSLPIAFATILNFVDDGNVVNVASLPSIGGFPSQFPIISYVGLGGAGSMSVGSLPSGYSGYVSNDFVNTVWLVITNGPFIAKSDTWGGAFGRDWDITTLNWTNAAAAVAYNDGDFVTFEDGARTNNVNLTGARQPASLTVNNSLLNYTFLGTGSISGAITLAKSGTATLTLTESGGDNFSGGIAVTGGTLILDNTNSAISGGVTVAANSTLQIGNNSVNGVLPTGTVAVDGTLVFSRSNDLTVGSLIAGTGSLVKNAAGKLTLTSVNPYTGATVVTNGTLALTGVGSISNSVQVSVSAAALDLSAKTVPTFLADVNVTNANLTVNMPNLNTPLNVTSLTPGGATNIINVTALPPIATYPVTLTLIQSANLINGFNFGLGTLPAGTPSFAGSVALSIDQLAVQLTLTAGPTGVRPQMFWTGADLPNSNTNWSDAQNWQLPGAPTPPDNVFFGGTGTTTASALSTPGGGSASLLPENYNNIMDANFTITSLVYTNLGGSYHNTHLADGRSLTISNAFTIGALDTGTTAQQEFVTISGSAATLSVSNTALNLQVWLGNANIAGVNNQATLDLSALDNFNATVNRLTVGASAINNLVNRPSGVLYLARTNRITAGFQTTTMHAGTTTGNSAIDVGDCNGNAGSASSLWLGQVNTLIADTIAIGRQKVTANLRFNTIYANIAPYPSLTLQGFTSSRVADFSVGDGVGNTGTTTLTANALLGGGYVNANVDIINVARTSSGVTGGGTITATLEFDAGTIDANTVCIGSQTAANARVGAGTVNVNTNAVIGTNAYLVVHGNLTLATNSNSAATTGTLNINGGYVQAGDIVAGINGAISTVTLNGGTLIVGGTAGNPSAPITVFNMTDSILQLTADGNAPALVASTINAGGTTKLNIGAIVNVPFPTTIPLISYVGANPFPNLSLGTVPLGFSATLVDNVGNSTIDLTILPPPTIQSVVQSGNSIVVSGTNGVAGNDYHVLTSTNLALPRSQWTAIATNQFGPGGGFTFTNAISPNSPPRFYLIRLP